MPERRDVPNGCYLYLYGAHGACDLGGSWELVNGTTLEPVDGAEDNGPGQECWGLLALETCPRDVLGAACDARALRVRPAVEVRRWT